MTQPDLPLLKALCETPGAPGREHKIRTLIEQSITNFADGIHTDSIGNLIALKKAKDNPSQIKVMLAAHMDEIGFIVTHIDESGFVRFHTLGGFDPKTLTAQRVIIHGQKDIVGVMGSKPIHVMTPEERNQVPKITDYFIDCGMSKEELSKFISVGDVITRERSLIQMGDCINCKSLDNRISVYILIEVLRQLGEDFPYDVYAVFTVQEEMGGRGAVVAAHNINPEFSLAIDTTIAYDVPGAKPQEMITKLGKGAAVKVMDSSLICDYRMVEFLRRTAFENDIEWQMEILTGGNTDAGPMQRGGKTGSIAGAVSIPTRHIHQVIEMVHKDDVMNAIALLTKALQTIHQNNWRHA